MTDDPQNQPPAPPAPPAPTPPTEPKPPVHVHNGPDTKTLLDAITGLPEALANVFKEQNQPPENPPQNPPQDPAPQQTPPAVNPPKPSAPTKRTFADRWFGTNK